MKNSQKMNGFTLIELLVVVAILGVLAGIVLPVYRGRAVKAKLSAAQAEISLVSAALDLFELDTGSYPSEEDGLDALLNEPGYLAGTDVWNGPYLKRRPRDPWGNPYIYLYPGVRNTSFYDLSSTGPDKVQGTEDDITNWDEE